MSIAPLIQDLQDIKVQANKLDVPSQSEKFFLMGQIYGKVSNYFKTLASGKYTASEFEELRQLLDDLKPYIPTTEDMADHELSIFAKACRVNLMEFLHRVDTDSLSGFMQD